MDKGIKQPEERIPLEIGTIQVNFCKNPQCKNFDTPASTTKQPRGPGAAKRGRDTYTVVGSGRGTPMLRCSFCGQYPTIKSNKAIHEEQSRFWKFLETSPLPTCPNQDCPNHNIDIRKGKALYQSFGQTKAGSKRHRCKACGKTFIIASSPTVRHRKPHKNAAIFRLIVNKVPFRRICEIEGITMSTLYRKINFIHQQCKNFAAGRERNLPAMSINRLYIGVDRQDYMINWSDAKDRRNIIFRAVGSADNTTGYILGLHLNFDPSMNPENIEKDAIASGDYDVKPAYRKHARLWLRRDYIEAIKKTRTRKLYTHSGSLRGNIAATYENVAKRDDVEMLDRLDDDLTLPKDGMQVRGEYTMYGHFFFLRKLLGNTNKIRFFLDQDSAFRAACLSAFYDRIMEGRCDAFYVRINSETTIDKKRQILAKNRNRMAAMKHLHPDLKDWQIKLLMIKENMAQMVNIGKWQDRWVEHPFPNMGEPEKAMCYLTDIQGYDEDHLAWLYNKASLHAIDRFFMQVRRRLSLLERPISSSSNLGRRWFGYGPYKPVMVGKLLNIFRVFYNFVEVGRNKQTPAMRIGLAKGKIKIEDIIYYQ
ncbi:MAG: IS1 family transposase [Desulfobacula sp.]|jgi:transposase-like protein|uniref:transposase n=1 Tax=Desulfobacula sp. TaxID=2593537 RepID=UPI001DC6DD36|nr:IS1 family transposase [Desulfobacula sp.]MBT7051921.1 IS1 family transposase [Desulfobacula sp.]MBT7259609.1 IS1 family transposase [Desulfobacula sp.]